MLSVDEPVDLIRSCINAILKPPSRTPGNIDSALYISKLCKDDYGKNVINIFAFEFVLLRASSLL